jgi:hypothetical protein
LLKENNSEIIAYISLNPLDDFSMILSFDADTVPLNTLIGGRGTVDAIIDPGKLNPKDKPAGTRYLILEDINAELFNISGYSGPEAWKNLDGTDFQAYANDIIEYNGTNWIVSFDSQTDQTVQYVSNLNTGTQYKWNLNQWVKSYQGEYKNGLWTLVL